MNLSNNKTETMYRTQFHGFDFSDIEISKAGQEGKLLLLQLFTSPICNFRCSYCYTNAGRKSALNLTFDEYRSIIDQGIELGLRTVAFTGDGEPLLDHNFIPLLDYISAHGLTTILFTNGSRLTMDIAKRLWEKNASVVIKLNSFNEKIQDKLTGIRGSAKLIQKGLARLLEMGFNKVYPTRLIIDSLICRQNADDIPELFTYARENNIEIIMELCKPFGRGKNNKLHLNKEDAKLIFQRLQKIDEEKFGNKWQPIPPLVAMICDKLYYGMFVDSQGYARPCTGIDIILGSIRGQPLHNLWNSPIMRKLRYMSKANLKGKCEQCKYDCYGCRGRALLESGDLFGEYIECWVGDDLAKQEIKTNAQLQENRA